MADWQPIETAPRDGTWLLCWEPGTEVDIMRWYAWSTTRGEWQSCEGIRTEPTHWQPLPAPPSDDRP